jgi:5-hydroxyisourate hydrolase
MSTISTHVLDVSLGRPAANVSVVLEAQSPSGTWSETGHGATDGDGRLKDLAVGKSLSAGTYRLSFDTRAYFAQRKIASLYPQVTITFEVNEEHGHYHIPLLLSPFGYSTYRGS